MFNLFYTFWPVQVYLLMTIFSPIQYTSICSPSAIGYSTPPSYSYYSVYSIVYFMPCE